MKYRQSYYDNCGNCEFYEFSSGNSKGFCSWYGSYYYPDESCSHQRNISKPEGGCYITTITCNILGYSDDSPILNSLRGLRDNVMQKDEKYAKLLMIYDAVGPQIASTILEQYYEDKDKKIPLAIYNLYLVPAAKLYDNKQYEDSINKYIDMIEKLESIYKIDIHNIDVKDYDYTKGGHGVKRMGVYYE